MVGPSSQKPRVVNDIGRELCQVVSKKETHRDKQLVFSLWTLCGLCSEPLHLLGGYDRRESSGRAHTGVGVGVEWELGGN